MAERTGLGGLSVPGTERDDNGTIPVYASFDTGDGLHAAVYDVRESHNNDTAYLVRVFDDLIHGDLLVQNRIRDPGQAAASQAVQDAVIAARIQQGATPEEAQADFDAEAA